MVTHLDESTEAAIKEQVSAPGICNRKLWTTDVTLWTTEVRLSFQNIPFWRLGSQRFENKNWTRSLLLVGTLSTTRHQQIKILVRPRRCFDVGVFPRSGNLRARIHRDVANWRRGRH